MSDKMADSFKRQIKQNDEYNLRAEVSRLTAENSRLAERVKELEQERDAFKRQCACRFCGDHHFNVSVCSKCGFKATDRHTLALAESRLSAAEKVVDRLRDALRPFAAAFKILNSGGDPAKHLTIAHLREAQDALDEAQLTKPAPNDNKPKAVNVGDGKGE